METEELVPGEYDILLSFFAPFAPLREHIRKAHQQ